MNILKRVGGLSSDTKKYLLILLMYELWIALAITDTDILQLRLGSALGFASSQYELGYIYAYGIGVPRDTGRSITWFTRAAENGSVPAQLELGEMFLESPRVARDIAKARLWLTVAAENGNKHAQYELACTYLTGDDASKDIEKAIKWLQLAAKNGHSRAQTTLRNLKAKLVQ